MPKDRSETQQPKIEPDNDDWIFINIYGSVWRLVRTDDPAMPLTILLVRRG